VDDAKRAELEAALGYRFSRPDLLEHALVHRSAPNEQPERYPASNERLEFLGDAFLDLVIAHALFENHPDAPEGELTRYKSTLVSEWALAELARRLDLGKHLILGRGEEETGGREKPSLLADALEAVLGAIYVDGGMARGEAVILALFAEALESVHRRSVPRGDYKTALQEWTQSHGLGLPDYQLLATNGPDHQRTYTSGVFLGKRELARGRGTSKREAERLAARDAYLAVLEEGDPGTRAVAEQSRQSGRNSD
jgi:ribonuclease-3